METVLVTVAGADLGRAPAWTESDAPHQRVNRGGGGGGRICLAARQHPALCADLGCARAQTRTYPKQPTGPYPVTGKVYRDRVHHWVEQGGAGRGGQ